MNKLIEWFKEIPLPDFGELKALLDLVEDRSGKSYPAIIWDMILCAFRYQATPRDYAMLGMFEMDEAQRATILTDAKNRQYLRALNQPQAEHYFTNKLEFLHLFKEEYGREYLDLSKTDADTFADFAIQHPSFIAKAEEEQGSSGAEKCALDPEEGMIGLYNRLKTSNKTLLEEVLEQHPKLEKLYPHSANTIRMVTMIDDQGETHLLYSALRIGRGGANTDDFNAGGLIIPIDPKTGKLEKYAVDRYGAAFERHPDTDVAFEGFAIPLWKETMVLTHKISKKVKGIRLVGWNLALTPKRPVLVKGSLNPTHEFYRPYPQNPEKRGMLPAFEAVVPYDSLKKKGRRAAK